MAICPECEGKKVVQCVKCDGKGNRYFVPVLDIWETDCDCYGSGVVTCTMCNGLGYTAGGELVLAPPSCAEIGFLSH